MTMPECPKQDSRPALLPALKQYPLCGEDAFFYLRYSAEEPEAAANSIENQRKFLYRHVKENPDLNRYRFGELADDGYTGTNFDRPAVRQLLDLIQRRKVKCILVKDYSRFCRNYIALGDYLEQVFPFLGIRFISVLDGYDSQEANLLSAGREISYKGFINDYYSRDISARVTAQKQMQMKEGRYIGPYAPYGYLKSPQDKGRLIINPETAPVVRLIYDMERRGLTDGQTAAELNRRSIPSPRKYMVLHGTGKGFRGFEQYVWERSCVANIATDIRYMGDLETHRWRRPAPCTRKFAAVPAEERYVFENALPAIVSREEYALVQEQRRKRATAIRVDGSRKNRLLTGKLRCANCGRQLLRRAHEDGRTDYICRRVSSAPGCGCPEDRVREEEVTEALLHTVKLHVKISCPFAAEELRKRKYAVLKSRMIKAGKDEENKTGRIRMLYEEYKRGVLTLNKFQALRQQLLEEKKEAQTLQKQLAGKLENSPVSGADQDRAFLLDIAKAMLYRVDYCGNGRIILRLNCRNIF